LPLALAACTYNPSAFENPRFEGEMSRAPEVLDIAEQAWQSNAGLIRDIPRIASRTVTLYQRLANRRLVGSQQCYTVLAISDLHNNPIAARFALDVAQTYDAKLVVIAGDFTDLGHPLEAELLAGLRRFQIPMVAVSGNHDSRSTVRALSSVPHLVMLGNGQTVTKAGLSIMGFGDPASRREAGGSVKATTSQLRSLSSRIASRLGGFRRPAILLVHNDRVGARAAGRAPIIVDGHSHTASVGARNGSVVINPGTTGAAGVRYFSAKLKPSCTCAVLRFTTGSRPKLKSVDSIRLEMPSGDFSVSRRSVTPTIAAR
jgi:Icc-related predicted phosphoesterase